MWSIVSINIYDVLKADKKIFTFAAVLQDVLSLSAFGGKRKVGTTQGAILLKGKGFILG